MMFENHGIFRLKQKHNQNTSYRLILHVFAFVVYSIIHFEEVL